MRMVVVIFILSSTMAYGQDPIFSQFYSSSLYLNPAMSGVQKNINFGLNYRSQWDNIELPFKTVQFSYIHPLYNQGPKPKHLAGIGISFFRDTSGPNEELSSTGINVAGGYNLHFDNYGNNFITFGLQAGLFQKQISADFFQWSSQYNPDVGYDNSLAGEDFGRQRHIYPLINAGMIWNYNGRGLINTFSTFHGISVNNLNKPDEAFIGEEGSRLPMLYKAHGAFNFQLNRKVGISPAYIVYFQNEMLQTNLGSFLSYSFLPNDIYSISALVIGMWYRTNDSFIFSTGYRSTKFDVGLSYDMNTSSLNRYFGNAGSYEISLAYKIVRQRQIKRFSTPLL